MNNYKGLTVESSFASAFAHLITGQSDKQNEFIKHVNLQIRDTEPDNSGLMDFSRNNPSDARPTVWICPNHTEEHDHRVALITRVDGVRYQMSHCELWTQPDGKRTWLLPNPMDGVGGFYFSDDLSIMRSYPAPIRDMDVFEPEFKKTRERLSELEKLYSDRP